MYKKILVAIDDSATSRCALDEAVALAKAHGAALCITHAADETLLGMHHRTLSTTLNLDDAREAIRKAGQALLDQAKSGIAGIAADTVLTEADTKRVSEAIIEVAKKTGADLIVVGTHGRRGLQRLIIGSVAEQLVRLAPVSILLVRKH